jgi:hypothetical protein
MVSSYTNAPTSLQQDSPLLKLPPELRLAIYDYLGYREPKSYPFGWGPISSIDRRLPSTALVTTCRYLHDEILRHFYNTVTFRAMAQNISHPKPRNISDVELAAIRRARKMDLRLLWDKSPKQSENRLDEDPYIMSRWLTDMTRLLLQEATSLEKIAVSVTCLDCGTDWEYKERLLAPLKMLSQRVVLCVGEVIAIDDTEEVVLKEWLKLYLEAINKGALYADNTSALW